MNKFLVLAVLGLLVAVCLSKSVPPNKRFLSKKNLIRGRPWHGLTPPPDPPMEKETKTLGLGYFDALVDNFDSSNKATYKQRYWWNDQWYKPGGPQFLMIGGESGENPYWVQSGTLEWTTLAQQNGALVLLLEHRFYGASQPTGDLSTKSLQYLSSEQALADVKNFIGAMNTKFNITSPRWITFGGSYSGALSAWARQMYPDVVYAAVGSSGPVQAVVDFTGYLDVVHNALKTYSQDCADSVQKGMAQINTLMGTSQGKTRLSQAFSTCDTLNGADQNTINYFYESIIGNYMGIVQYSQDNVGSYADTLTIPALCKVQTSATGDDMAGVVAVNTWMMEMYGEGCTYVDYNGYIDYLKTATPGTDAGDYRAWVWQTCTEFGYYQSTDSAESQAFYGPVIPADWYVQQCAPIYGDQFTNASVYAAIDKTNSIYYGQNNFNGTKVVLPNGTNDPWHVLGILNAPNNKVYPILIDGTSHCADMYPPSANDKPGLTRARASVTQYVNSWVSE